MCFNTLCPFYLWHKSCDCEGTCGRSLREPVTITTSNSTGGCSDSNFQIVKLQEEVKYLRIQLALSKAKENPVNLFPELTSQERAENAEIVELTLQLEKAQEEIKDLQSRYIELQKDHAECTAQRDKLLLENSKLKEKLLKGMKI